MFKKRREVHETHGGSEGKQQPNVAVNTSPLRCCFFHNNTVEVVTNVTSCQDGRHESRFGIRRWIWLRRLLIYQQMSQVSIFVYGRSNIFTTRVQANSRRTGSSSERNRLVPSPRQVLNVFTISAKSSKTLRFTMKLTKSTCLKKSSPCL